MFLAGCNGRRLRRVRGRRRRTPAPGGAGVAQPGRRRDRRLARRRRCEIAVTGGELGDVTVVDGAGTQRGRLRRADAADAARQPTVWTPEDQLAYGTSYTLTATATNAADEEATASLDLHHRHARRRVSTPSIGPLDGTTVGVGMPIRVYFDDPVADKAAVESHLKVTSVHARPTARGTG